MIRESTAMNVRQNLGDLLNEVYYRHDSILIKKAGKPIAALIDIELFQKINSLKAKFEKLTAELGAPSKKVSASILQKEIQEAISKKEK